MMKRLLIAAIAWLAFGAATFATAPTFQSSQQNSTGAATSLAVTKPTSTADGDLLLGCVTTRGTSITHTTPSGWTLVDSSSTGTSRISIFYKIASGEGASQTFQWSSSARAIVRYGRITGHDGTTPINGSSKTGSSLVCPSVTTTVNDCLILRLFGGEEGSSSTNTEPGSTTSLWNQTEGVSAGHAQGCASETLASAGSTGTKTWTRSGGSNNNAFTLAIAPSGGSSSFVPRLVGRPTGFVNGK